jgi:hypothetical protein
MKIYAIVNDLEEMGGITEVSDPNFVVTEGLIDITDLPECDDIRADPRSYKLVKQDEKILVKKISL